MMDNNGYQNDQSQLHNSGGPPLDRRKAVVPPWPSRDTERHWHTYGIAFILILMSVIGFFLVDTLTLLRIEVKEVKAVVTDNAATLVDVQKKLVAVATDEKLLRKSVDRHLDKEHKID